MTNTHFVDDDVLVADASDDPRAWPLEALATAPLRPIEALLPLPRQRRFRSVYPHEERVPTRVDDAPVARQETALPGRSVACDVRDEQAWG